jgi:DNA invertase Pin-like site-specific DNA recombinase
MADGEFDVLVFDRQDRLARDGSETLRFVADAKDAGVLWHAVKHGLIDLSEPIQVLSAIMRGGEAERYSTSISTNQKNGNVEKRKKGLRGAGPRPFGNAHTPKD